MSEEVITGKLDFNKSEQYILSIRLSTDGFSFSIYNPIRDRFILLQQWEIESELSFTANLKQVYKELDFLSYTYKQVQVVLVTPRFTLLPAELFDEQQTESLFYYNYKPRENEIILKNNLTKNEAVILYAFDKSAYHFLCEQYPNIQFYSSVSALAERFAVRSRLDNNKKMYVSLYPTFMALYVFERGYLMLLNLFECKNTSDRIYYLLNVWKQSAMDQRNDELHIISGDDADNDRGELIEAAQPFVQHISTIDEKINAIISNV